MITGTTAEPYDLRPVTAFDLDTIAESPYVIGMRKQAGYKVIEACIAPEWDIPKKFFPDEGEINVNVADNPHEPNAYLFYSTTASFSSIYNLLMEVVTYNKELEEKSLIFNQMQVVLQGYFDTLSLADFKKIKITHPTTNKTDGTPLQQERDLK